jgi:DNA transformation protein
MSFDREAIAEMFSAFGPVVVKGMFGGAGIYADGIFFALVDDGIIYLKADDETRPRFEAEGCVQFVYEGKTREVAMSYWRMPERLYDDPEELAQWARLAVAAAHRAAALKARGKGKGSKAPRKGIKPRGRS